MVIKLSGTSISPSLQVAMVICHELNIPYEIIPVDILKRENKHEEHMKYHPFGQVPYLIDDDGFSMYESRAIARYLAARYGNNGVPRLVPDANDWHKSAKFEEAASVESTQFTPRALGLAIELVFKPINAKLPRDEEAIAKRLAEVNEKLDVYERILSNQRYIAGDELTLVDFFYLPLGNVWKEQGKIDVLGSENRPNVARWWKEISSRPSWLAVKATID